MHNNSVGITGLTRQYPEFKYSTKEMIDLLGNKLTEKVKENIFQLGVESRHFINPLDAILPNQILKENQILIESQFLTCLQMLHKNASQI